MSEYTTIKSIKLKNEILAPKVISAVESKNFTFDIINDLVDPLKDEYKNTYKYVDATNNDIINYIDKRCPTGSECAKKK